MRLMTTSDVQSMADYSKFRYFASSYVAEAAEASQYDPAQLQFLAKVTTLQFIPAALDFWGSQLASKTTTGTNEVVAYRDQREFLWKLYEQLAKEVEEDFEVVIGGGGQILPRVSYYDNGRNILITEDPQDFGSLGETVDLRDLLPFSLGPIED